MAIFWHDKSPSLHPDSKLSKFYILTSQWKSVACQPVWVLVSSVCLGGRSICRLQEAAENVILFIKFIKFENYSHILCPVHCFFILIGKYLLMTCFGRGPTLEAKLGQAKVKGWRPNLHKWCTHYQHQILKQICSKWVKIMFISPNPLHEQSVETFI